MRSSYAVTYYSTHTCSERPRRCRHICDKIPCWATRVLMMSLLTKAAPAPLSSSRGCMRLARSCDCSNSCSTRVPFSEGHALSHLHYHILFLLSPRPARFAPCAPPSCPRRASHSLARTSRPSREPTYRNFARYFSLCHIATQHTPELDF